MFRVIEENKVTERGKRETPRESEAERKEYMVSRQGAKREVAEMGRRRGRARRDLNIYIQPSPPFSR